MTVSTDTAVYNVTQYQRIEDIAKEIGIGLEEWFQCLVTKMHYWFVMLTL